MSLSQPQEGLSALPLRRALAGTSDDRPAAWRQNNTKSSRLHRLSVRISVDRPPLQSGRVQCSDLGGTLPFSAPAAPLWGDQPGLLAVGGGSGAGNRRNSCSDRV